MALTAKALLAERDRLIDRIESVEADKARLATLNKLITQYADEEDVVEFVCSHCNKGFQKEGYLNRHIQIKHKGAK